MGSFYHAVPQNRGVLMSPIQSEKKRSRNEPVYSFTWFDVIVVLVSMGTYLADIITDILVTLVYWKLDEKIWAGLTVTFLIVPSIIMQVFSTRWYVADGHKATFSMFFIHIFMMGPIKRYIAVLKYGIRAKRTKRIEDYQAMYSELSDVSMLRLFESFLESAPQLVLQLYIMIKVTEDDHILTGIAAFFSLISLAWAIAAYTKALRTAAYSQDNRKKRVSWSGLALQTLWRVGMVSGRIVALVLFATAYPVWLLAGVGIHWLVMTIWLVAQDTDFCGSWWEERLFNIVVGVIHIFCFFNMKEGRSRWRMMFFYMITFIENSAMITLWFPNRTIGTWYNIPALIVVWGGFIIATNNYPQSFVWLNILLIMNYQSDRQAIGDTEGKDDRTLNPKLQKLEDEEKLLATKLKSICGPSGEEKREALEDSADILMKLGDVYLQRATIETGIDQKMSYIKSAVLLQAAIGRFQLVKNQAKISVVKNLREELSRSVLKSSYSQRQTDLFDISQRLFEKVCKKRVEIQKILDRDLNRDGENDPLFSARHGILEKLNELDSKESVSLVDLQRILCPDREEKENKIAEKMRKINDDVTAFYNGIMREIATECLGILLPPACTFAIAGLGSLARKEATLYSDFEHIILLEDGIEDEKSYESILEYFRWFSVVFQLIVIGFGETIIPSVAVKSLNDFYSEDTGENWFYDNFTQNGISFDGMLPHACKIPLGRQQETKFRHHVVELIKTPQKMANYLTQDEQLKNGYHLADVLRQTCLVYGDDQIYSSFIKERAVILEREFDKVTNQEFYAEMISNNSSVHVRHANPQMSIEQIFDSKPVFYRPLATYIGVIARIHNFEEKSTFEIIDEFYTRKIIGPFTYNKLKYSFAAACEIRMKIYHKADQQRHTAQLEDVAAIVGKETVDTCTDMMQWLQQASAKMTEKQNLTALAAVERILTNPNMPYAVLYLEERGHFAEAIRLGERVCHNLKRRNTILDIALFECYYKAGLNDQRFRQKYFQKAEELYFELPASPAADFNMAIMFGYHLRCPPYPPEQYRKCIAMYEKFFNKYFHTATGRYDDAHFLYACCQYYTIIEFSDLDADKGDERLKALLWDKSDNMNCKLLQRMHLVQRDLDKRDAVGEDFRKELSAISVYVEKYAKKIFSEKDLQFWISSIYIQMWELENAVKALQSASLYHRARSGRDRFREREIQLFEALKLLSLCRLYGNKVAQKIVDDDKKRLKVSLDCSHGNHFARNPADGDKDHLHVEHITRKPADGDKDHGKVTSHFSHINHIPWKVDNSDDDPDKVLLQYLVKILWRGMNLSPAYIYELIIALTWVVYMKYHGQIISNVFLMHRGLKDPKGSYVKVQKATNRFAKDCFGLNCVDWRILFPFAMLLLVKSL